MVVGNGGNTQMSVLMGDGTGDFSSVASYPATGSGVRGIAVLDAEFNAHGMVQEHLERWRRKERRGHTRPA